MTRYPVMYDDSDLLVITKPSGVLSHPNPPAGPSGGVPKQSPAAFLGKYNFEDRCFETPDGPLWLLHRLDQDASGLLMSARTPEAAKAVRTQFEMKQIKKIYLALVYGRPQPLRGTWKDAFAESRQKRVVRSRIQAGVRPNAELKYSVKRQFPQRKASLLEMELITGKTHQIRVQGASRHHPVAGDDVYGMFAWNRKIKKETGLKRLFLHAAQLELRHPRTQEWIKLEAVLPDELNQCLERMG